jgi:hypothetical protein
MTVHDIGARLPAGFQDANYFAQGGDATSGAHLACNYLHDCLYVSCPWKSVSIRTSLDSGAKRNVLKRSGFECPFQAR